MPFVSSNILLCLWCLSVPFNSEDRTMKYECKKRMKMSVRFYTFFPMKPSFTTNMILSYFIVFVLKNCENFLLDKSSFCRLDIRLHTWSQTK